MKSKTQTKEYLHSRFSVKTAEEDRDTGYVEGVFSAFGNVDFGRDIVHKGAFTKTISENGGVFPFLLDHSYVMQAGYTVEMAETAKGVEYRAEWKLVEDKVRQRFELIKLSLKLKKPMGNSFGYLPVKYDFEEVEAENGPVMVRNLREVRLFEVTSTVFPMNDRAGVTGAKGIQETLAALKQGGYSVEEIKEALSRLSGPDQPPPSQIDPQFSQSVEALRGIFKP